MAGREANKAKFGAVLRSKTGVTRVNELLCNGLAHKLGVVSQTML
jgi:hypothetical protein